jgi:hypothetical protein
MDGIEMLNRRVARDGKRAMRLLICISASSDPRAA